MNPQDPQNPKRSLSEISHLFLSSIREKQTNGAPRPQRKAPAAKPQAADDSLDLTPEEFSQVSDARRCAWAWRRYVEAVRSAGAGERLLEIRYESFASCAEDLAAFLGADVAAAHRALDGFRDTSIGRWRTELTPEQVADVEAEAGPLLAELGYS